LKAEPEFNFPDLVKELNKEHIRYILIGRQALILYGAPLLSFDYDLWVHPDDRKKLLQYLVNIKNFEITRDISDPSPICTVFAGTEKVDLFFNKTITNLESETIDFEVSYNNAIKIRDDSDPDFLIRIPSIEDLVKLKKLRARNMKDEEDIKYLLSIKSLEK
jgi:hypothetical protein